MMNKLVLIDSLNDLTNIEWQHLKSGENLVKLFNDVMNVYGYKTLINHNYIYNEYITIGVRQEKTLYFKTLYFYESDKPNEFLVRNIISNIEFNKFNNFISVYGTTLYIVYQSLDENNKIVFRVAFYSRSTYDGGTIRIRFRIVSTYYELPQDFMGHDRLGRMKILFLMEKLE